MTHFVTSAIVFLATKLKVKANRSLEAANAHPEEDVARANDERRRRGGAYP